jgi:hypothetical protein
MSLVVSFISSFLLFLFLSLDIIISEQCLNADALERNEHPCRKFHVFL